MFKPCGLLVDVTNQYLCASPDGLLNDDGLLEAKCPYTAFRYDTIVETSKKHRIGVKICKKGCLCLPKTHPYYHQIQGQLHISNRVYCDLAVWSPTDFFVQRIQRDTKFWKTAVPKLREFFFHYLLPELLDPRVSRSMELRQDPVT
ncbi:unnamed protein product [Ixodes hexagonus]